MSPASAPVRRLPERRQASSSTSDATVKVMATMGSRRRQSSQALPQPVDRIPCQNRSGGLVLVIPCRDARGSQCPVPAVTRAIWM
jgi:hypothetical protein